MGYMQRSVRFPEELDALIVARAAADDRSFSYVVLRALESALGGAEEPVQKASGRAASAPARASVPGKSDRVRLNEIEREVGSSVKDPRAALPPGVRTAAELMRERQERLNKRKS